MYNILKRYILYYWAYAFFEKKPAPHIRNLLCKQTYFISFVLNFMQHPRNDHENNMPNIQ